MPEPPKALEKELEEYMKTEHLEKSTAVRKLLIKSLQQWREEYALKLLADGRTTISKAAEIAGVDKMIDLGFYLSAAKYREVLGTIEKLK